MNKFLFASLAVLCTILSSCTNFEYELEDTNQVEVTNNDTHEVSARSASTITVSFTDSTGSSQTITCEEARLTYISRTTIEVFIKYSDGTTQTEMGDDISVLPNGGDLKVTTSPTNTFTTPDLDVEACMPECCYTYNNGNNVGTALSFVVEDEPHGY